MGNFKMSKLYTAVIATILLCMTILSGNAYAEDTKINEKSVNKICFGPMPTNDKKALTPPC